MHYGVVYTDGKMDPPPAFFLSGMLIPVTAPLKGDRVLYFGNDS